jgi:tetratricopeptide (TPR) repeat protein
MLAEMDLLVEGIKRSGAKTSKEEKLERLKFYAEIAGMEESTEDEDLPQTKVVPLYGRRWFLAAAASVALLIAAGTWYNTNVASDPQQLFEAYFEAFDSPGSGLTRGNEGVTAKGAAYDAYDNGRYAEAIPLFENILANNNDPIVLLCLGNAQLKVGKIEQAENTFTQLLTQHNDLITQAKWYLALTYLKEDKLDRSKAALWELAQSSTYGEKAQSLLKKLE